MANDGKAMPSLGWGIKAPRKQVVLCEINQLKMWI